MIRGKRRVFMQLPLQITFRNMDHSTELEEIIQKKAVKLETFYDRIMGCRVMVEAPHKHHQHGHHYHVRVDLTVPGEELVINRDPPKHEAFADAHVAIRDAFDAARRQLQAYIQRRRGDVKNHGKEPKTLEVPTA